MRFGGVLFITMLFLYFNLGAQELKLDQLRWEKRVLLLVTSTEDSSFFTEQSRIFSDLQIELEERKLLLIDVRKNRYRILSESSAVSHEDRWIIDEKLYNRYSQDLKKDELILIGLDGGIKLRQSENIDAEALFTLIDGMPMRRAEMRRN